MKPSVLIVDEELATARLLAEGLEDAGFRVEIATGGSRLKRSLNAGPFDVVLTDPSTAGMGELSELLGAEDLPAVILLAAFGSVQDAVVAMREGAFDYIEKPASDDQILVAVRRALEQRTLRVENKKLRADLERRFELASMLSRDPKMRRVFDTVAAVRDTRATILIEGESGTGKTMLARAIHKSSERAAAPFIEVNCGALPAGLLESELFGHVRGAFTGAVRDKAGKFEAAHGGTLFLDEIATAPHDLQVKLLRVLQDKVFERVGDTKTRTVDVRVVAATNRRLADEVAAGRFREDLYYRIRVLSVELPPLRERPGDVALLAEAFVKRFAEEHGRAAGRLSPACLPLLTAHGWPGNVRELEHCIERAVLLSTSEEIQPSDLEPELASLGRADRPHPSGSNPASSAPQATAGVDGPAGQPEAPGTEGSPQQGWAEPSPAGPLREALEGPEREIIRRALMIHGGNRSATARMLDINRTTLFNKMKKYGLMDVDFQGAGGSDASASAPRREPQGEPGREPR